MREPVVAGESQLKLRCPAQSQYVALVRHALGAFLRALEFEGGSLDDVTTAAGEALANIVEHAYGSSSTASECLLELHARVDRKGTLCVDVSDSGSFIERRPLPGRGFGLRIIQAVAGKLTIDTSGGTCVRMTFNGKR
ncbi:MAG: ATP-binding protein [Candidatus Cybelea sp.]